MLWEEICSGEFEQAVKECNGVCAIPIGCMEMHGVHLPLGCDTIKGREFAVRAAKREPVCIFPAMYFGEKSGANEYPGTIIFPQDLIREILRHSCREIARNGFKKIVLVSAHGGNTNMLNAFTRDILCDHPDFLVFHYYMKMAGPEKVLAERERFDYLTESDIAILQDYVDKGKHDGHGGFVETGCLYDICPELIKLDKIDHVSGTSTHLMDGFAQRGITTSFNWMGNQPNSYHCDIHYGLNERIARALAEKAVDGIAEAFRYLREETISEQFNAQWRARIGV